MSASTSNLGELRDHSNTSSNSAIATSSAEVAEILCSQHVDDKISQSIRFVVQGPVKSSSLVLCWVNHEGKLFHHYTYENNRMDHDESSYIGDAFVAYAVVKDDDDGRTTGTKPLTLEELKGDSCYSILCSYRLLRPAKDEHIHLIRFSLNQHGSVNSSITEFQQDHEYRILVGIGEGKELRRLPPPHKPWEVVYQYVCPPIPSSAGWDPKTHTFYVWGDMDFDDYGDTHRRDITDKCRAVHPCAMNQIVPQVMIGNCLASNSDDGNYSASWTCFDSWVMQAQYFFQDENGKGRALCGSVVKIDPGDLIWTSIRYDPADGAMYASIAVVGSDEKRSDIKIERPFPHNPTLFHDWKDFFQKCLDAEKESLPRISWCSWLCGSSDDSMCGALGRPYLNVEYKGRVDIETLKSLCPFVVKEATYPGITSQEAWKQELFCPRFGRCDKLYDENHDLELKDALVMELG